MTGYPRNGSGLDLAQLWVGIVLTVASAALLVLFFPGAGFLALLGVATTAFGVRAPDRYHLANRSMLVACSLIVLASALLALFLLAAGTSAEFVDGSTG